MFLILNFEELVKSFLRKLRAFKAGKIAESLPSVWIFMIILITLITGFNKSTSSNQFHCTIYIDIKPTNLLRSYPAEWRCWSQCSWSWSTYSTPFRPTPPRWQVAVLYTLECNFDLSGRRSDGYRGLAHCMHRVRVRSSHWVHRHPPQDEDQEAHRSQTEERQLRSHGFSIFCCFSSPLRHLQPDILVVNMVEQEERTTDV